LPRTEPASDAALDAVELRLQGLLDPYRDRLEPVEVYGQPFLRRPGATKHQWFAGVNRANGVVRLSLLPMYAHPELLDGLTPELLRRKRAATVFAFSTVDEAQLRELEELLARAFAATEDERGE
jgi:hypothetical protein